MSLLFAFQGYQQVVTTLEFRSQLESLSVNDLKKYLFLVVLGLCCCPGFSLVEVHEHLIMVASLVAEYRLQGKWASVVAAHRLSSCGPQALEHRPNICGISDQLLCGMWNLPASGIKPIFPVLAGRFFTTKQPGKSFVFLCVL